ncbi:uncharacterized protein [Epargyreus clarus]|uniref:uncharacterized protein n=1 Tax=Epargyreus clarus TaxID=520877 RepID=UPI003C2FBA90
MNTQSGSIDVNLNKSLSESNLTVNSQKENKSPSAFVSTRNKRKRVNEEFSTELTAFKEEIKQLLVVMTSKNEEELRKITPTLVDIQQSNRNIENSIAFLTAQNEEYKKKIEELEAQAREDRKNITILEEKIEDLQRNARKASFEIKNVPKKENENKEDLIEMIKCLSKSIGCDVSRKEIRDIYRVRTKKESVRNTPIIVETTTTLIKNDFLKMCKAFNIKHKSKLCAKHLGFRTSEDTPIFVSENLTAKSSRLHFLGRELVKSRRYKYCWTAYGKVYLRRDDNSPVIILRDEMQVQNLLQHD